MMEGDKRRQFPWTGAAAFIISLLLTASVASLIYVTINGSTYSCGGAQKGEMLLANVDDQGRGDMSIEKIRYDTGRHVAFFTDAEGNTIAEDYMKGLSVYQAADLSVCYVIAVGTNTSAGRDIIDFVRNYHKGDEVIVQEKEIWVYTLPGEIKDISFLPDEMNDRCDSYHWVAVGDQASELETMNNSRVKRGEISVSARIGPVRIKVTVRW